VSVYEQLQAKLATHPMGAPPRESFLEILRILFTPVEAAVALSLPFKPGRDTEIAHKAGLPVEELITHCEAMADKGLVYAYESKGRHFYMLFPTAPGLFEFPLMKVGRLDLPFDRLGELWHEYYQDGWGEEMTGTTTHMGRVIPIQEAVEAHQTVLAYEQVAGYLDKAKYISVQDCPCRVSKRACDAPIDVCLALDYGAKFLAERGMGRLIDRDEALSVLNRARDAGLVHMTSNTLDKVEFICNCCPCCCGLLGTVTRLGAASAKVASNFHAVVDADECLACALCEDACPVDAISMAEVAEVDQERCIGCGVCVTRCESGALALVRRDATHEPPKDYATWLVQVALEKDRLEALSAQMQ
jgi:ferredoxin